MKDLLNIDCSENTRSCVCMEDLPHAYSYVRNQLMNKTYSSEKALSRGTAFPELDKPFGVYGNECLTKEMFS